MVRSKVKKYILPVIVWLEFVDQIKLNMDHFIPFFVKTKFGI